MVIMTTKNKIQRLRKFFESGSSNSFDLNGETAVSPSQDRNKRKKTKANTVLLDRSSAQNHTQITPSDCGKLPSRLGALSDLKNKIKFSRNQVKLVRKGGVRFRAREGPPEPPDSPFSYQPETTVWTLVGRAASSSNPPLKLPRSKSTGQLNILEEEEELRSSTAVVAERSLSENPLRTETEYAVPCSIPAKEKPKSAPAEYENTRRFANRILGKRENNNCTDNSIQDSTQQDSVPSGVAGTTYRYRTPIERKQGYLDRRSSRSLPDLSFQEGSIKIVGARGLFQNLNNKQRTPQKPAVPIKSPTLSAKPIGNGIRFPCDPSLQSTPVNHSSTFLHRNPRSKSETSTNVESLRTRFEERVPTTPSTSELPGYEKPNISEKPVSGGEDPYLHKYYHIPDKPTNTRSDLPNVYEIPDGVDTIEDSLGGTSGNEEKLKKIFGVQSLQGDILDKNNQMPSKKVRSSKKKKSTVEKNQINYYAVSQLQTSNTNLHLRGRNMDGNGGPLSPKLGLRSLKENSSSSADSGNSHTYSLKSLSPRTSERKPSSDDPNLRDSDFIDGEPEFDERGPTVSDSDFESEEEASKSAVSPKVKAPEPPAFNNNSHKVAYELLTSERTYVDKLYLLSAIYQTKISADNEKHRWFSSEVVKDIFANISSIYNFHFGHFLPELEMRLLEWDRRPCIGDILRTLSPFLKMYADYVSNFDKAMSQLNTWRAKVPKFANALSTITQNEKRCNGLALEHHMLEPVQRIPRYELLLKEYLKKLPEDSQDRVDAEKALEVISQAAEHSNNRMKVMEEIGNLFKLNMRIDGMDIINPSRRLLKEGKLEKVTHKNDLQERYIFFFNDILLCCASKRKVYKLKEKIEVDGMQVLGGDGERFQVEGNGVLLEFMAASEEDKEDWLKVLWGAVKELMRKKDTFKNNIADAFEVSYEDTLGKEPPKYIRDEEVTMCMRCGTDFERLLKRRHHCRACGYVICGRCSCNQIEIAYDNNKLNRVCGRCFQKLGKQPVMDDLTRRSFVPNLEETEHYATPLHLLQKGSWVKFWVAVTSQDLFALKAPRDVRAVLTLPVKLYEVREVSGGDGVTDKDYVFKLEHGQTSYFFSAESYSLKAKWMKILSEGVEAHVNNKSEITTL